MKVESNKVPMQNIAHLEGTPSRYRAGKRRGTSESRQMLYRSSCRGQPSHLYLGLVWEFCWALAAAMVWGCETEQKDQVSGVAVVPTLPF